MDDPFSYAESKEQENRGEGHDPGKSMPAPDIQDVDSNGRHSGFDLTMFRDLLDISSVGFYVTDTASGVILFFNDGFYRMWHLEEIGDAMRSGKAKNSDVLAYLKSRVEDVPKFLDTWEPLQDRENPAIVYTELKLTDGRLVELFSTPVHDDQGSRQRRLFIFEDITLKRATIELTTANKRLLEENEKRTALLDDLQEKQFMLAHAQQIAHLGSWTVDLVNDKAIYSDELARIYGLAPGKEVIDDNVLLKAIHPEDIDRYLAWSKASGKKRDVGRIDFRIVRRNGAIRFIHCEVEYEFDDTNEPLRMFGTAQDMTEIIEARARLKRMTDTEMLVLDISRRLLHLDAQDIDAEIGRVLKTIGQIARADRSYVFLLSEDDTRMDNTHEWCADGIGSHKDLLQKIEAGRFSWLFKRLKMFGAVNIPSIARMPDIARLERQELLTEGVRSIVIVPMIYGGTLIGLIGFDALKEERSWSVEDVTMLKLVGSALTSALMRKGAEMAIYESETKLRLITESVGFPMLICKGEKIIYANVAAGKISGYTGGEIESKSIIELVHPEHRELAQDRLLNRLIGRNVPSKYDLKFLRKDGSERWLEVLTERGELDGKPVIIVAGTDITERKAEELNMKRVLAEKDAQIKLLSAGRGQRKKRAAGPDGLTAEHRK